MSGRLHNKCAAPAWWLYACFSRVLLPEAGPSAPAQPLTLDQSQQAPPAACTQLSTPTPPHTVPHKPQHLGRA